MVGGAGVLKGSKDPVVAAKELSVVGLSGRVVLEGLILHEGLNICIIEKYKTVLLAEHVHLVNNKNSKQCIKSNKEKYAPHNQLNVV